MRKEAAAAPKPKPKAKPKARAPEAAIGRILHFHPPSGTVFAGRTLAAIITEVLPDNRVNAAIFKPDGCPMPQPPTGLDLVPPGGEPPQGRGYWTWPPRA